LFEIQNLIRRGNYEPVQILQRHHFASYLKRMSTVVRVQESYFAFVKVWIATYAYVFPDAGFHVLDIVIVSRMPS
jgi:hypothetical protein